MFVSYCFYMLLGLITALDCFIKAYIVFALKSLYGLFLGNKRVNDRFHIPNHLAVLFVDDKLINFVRFF